MSDRLPRSEYDVNYLQIIIFIIIFISLLLISFFAGYYAGKKSSVKNSDQVKTIEKLKSGERKKINEPVGTKKLIIEKQKTKKKSKQKTEIKVSERKNEKQLEKKKVGDKKKGVFKVKKRVYRKGYYVQVEAFKDLKSAETKAKIYRRKFKIIIYYPSEKDKIKWYRLWIGPYSDKTRVKRALLRLKTEFGIKGFVRKLD